jgi:YVTN family beta-propeller protein
MKHFVLYILLFLSTALFSQDSLRLKRRITDDIFPKSVVHSGDGLFAAQNKNAHSINFYNRNYETVAVVYDDIDLSKFDTSYNSIMTWGAPEEGTFSDVGKYYWVSNFKMEGGNFKNAPCESCSGKNYDASFVYKINTWNFKIEKVVEVGSGSKAIASNDALKMIAVANYSSGDVHIINSKTNKVIKQLNVGKYPSAIVFHQSKKQIYVALAGEKNIAVVNTKNWQISYLENVGSSIYDLCLDEKKNILYASLKEDGKVVKINLNNNATQYLKTGREPRSITLNSDGKYLYVVNYGDNSAVKIKTDSLLLKQKVRTAKQPVGISIDEKKGDIWVACLGGEINVFGDKNLLKKSAYDKYLASLMGKPSEKETTVYLPEIKEEIVVEKKEVIVPKKKTESGKSEAWIAVAGTFREKENAKNLQEQLMQKGYLSEVLERDNGMYMVTYGSAINRKEIDDLAEEVKSDGMQVIITRR